MFQFPIASLWRDYGLQMAFKSSGVEAPWAVPIRLPRYVTGAKWALHLWTGHGGERRILSNKHLCIKPERGIRSRAWQPMRDAVDRFARFVLLAAQNTQMDKLVTPFTQQLLWIREYHGEVLLREYLCSNGLAQSRCHGDALVGLAPPNKVPFPPTLKYETL